MMPNTVSAVPDGAKDAVNISGVLSFNNTGTGAMFAGGYRSDYCNRIIHQVIKR